MQPADQPPAAQPDDENQEGYVNLEEGPVEQGLLDESWVGRQVNVFVRQAAARGECCGLACGLCPVSFKLHFHFALPSR